MTPDSTALDAAIRQARHLLFAFDGPVRSADKARSIGSAVVTALTSAYLHDALAACHESGRSVAVISADSPTEVHDYLNAHDLSTQVAVVAVSIGEAVSTLAKPLRSTAHSSPVPRPTSKPPKPQERRPLATPERARARAGPRPHRPGRGMAVPARTAAAPPSLPSAAGRG